MAEAEQLTRGRARISLSGKLPGMGQGLESLLKVEGLNIIKLAFRNTIFKPDAFGAGASSSVPCTPGGDCCG